MIFPRILLIICFKSDYEVLLFYHLLCSSIVISLLFWMRLQLILLFRSSLPFILRFLLSEMDVFPVVVHGRIDNITVNWLCCELGCARITWLPSYSSASCFILTIIACTIIPSIVEMLDGMGPLNPLIQPDLWQGIVRPITIFVWHDVARFCLTRCGSTC